MLADQFLADQLDRRLRRVQRRHVEDRHAELDRVGRGQVGRRDQLLFQQVTGQRPALAGGRVHRLAGGGLVQGAVHDQAPGNAGDAHQIRGRDGCHRSPLK